MKRAWQILGSGALMLVVLLLLGVLFAYTGIYNVAATTRHAKPFEQFFRIMTVRSVSAHARGITPPANFNPKDHALAERAAGHFEMMCRTCHGAPGKKPDPWQLYPPPPDLADALRVTGWTDAEVFWITKNGIKDTAMSAFGGSHDDDDLWALTAFIRQLESITPDHYRAMVEQAPMKGSHSHAAQPEGHAHTPESAPKAEPPHQH